MPPPQATSTVLANKTAPSAAIKRMDFDTRRAL
jgi:hypothetical protein